MARRVDHAILFNFSASPIGGGLKRLSEYAKWFDAHGGAWFMVHPRCRPLIDQFPRNRYFVIDRPRLARIVNDFLPVRQTLQAIGIVPDCYFAFGIPLYARVARVNWFHLSNVLPLAWHGMPLARTTQLRFQLLGRQTRRGLKYADVISAESLTSLSLFDPRYHDRLFLSVLGSDDEIAAARVDPGGYRPIAVVVGTYSYKALDRSVRVFEALKQSDPELRMLVFGDDRQIPAAVRTHADVIIRGERPRSEVIATLRQARYYISTTMIEGSYNAASEGIFLAERSYISDIGPHRELLAGQKVERLQLPDVAVPLLCVRRAELSTENLKTWGQVIAEMNRRIADQLQPSTASPTHDRQNH